MKISLNKKKLTDIAFIVPSLAGVSIFVLIPFIDVLRRSFTNVSGTQFVFFSNTSRFFRMRHSDWRFRIPSSSW